MDPLNNNEYDYLASVYNKMKHMNRKFLFNDDNDNDHRVVIHMLENDPHFFTEAWPSTLITMNFEQLDIFIKENLHNKNELLSQFQVWIPDICRMFHVLHPLFKYIMHHPLLDRVNLFFGLTGCRTFVSLLYYGNEKILDLFVKYWKNGSNRMSIYEILENKLRSKIQASELMHELFWEYRTIPVCNLRYILKYPVFQSPLFIQYMFTYAPPQPYVSVILYIMDMPQFNPQWILINDSLVFYRQYKHYALLFKAHQKLKLPAPDDLPKDYLIRRYAQLRNKY